MSHPPVPPNDERFFFSKLVDGFCFVATNFPQTSLDRPVCMRRIVADVARCAWLDEAKRLSELNLNTSTAQIEGVVGWLESIDIATDNAEAWRVWGLHGKENEK